ncbi:DUF6985 domain-containing protein [Photobacterium halotolerans]|uniref:DUF6985 domain-containing protein n=1 Tax=Photobacterium halotolerans TaxID=265726 RepID=A0A0F5VDN4_9GAMM|nr:hypothetical protein [Photobacterium halotolerans]KKC99589.1 hypothetical protein KY46_11685 [Photobacterium halotolerans]
MKLIKNIENGEFGIEGEVFFREFEKYIGLSIEGDNIEFAQKCAEYLNALPEDLFESLCEASIRYCNSFLSAIGEPAKSFEKSSDVIGLIYPSILLVPYPEKENEPVIHMELNCEWEPEHGMEWLIRGNKVLYVGAFNGEDPWSDFSKKEEWNYA